MRPPSARSRSSRLGEGAAKARRWNRRRQGESQGRERIPTRGADLVRGSTPFPSRERLDGRFSCSAEVNLLVKGECQATATTIPVTRCPCPRSRENPGALVTLTHPRPPTRV